MWPGPLKSKWVVIHVHVHENNKVLSWDIYGQLISEPVHYSNVQLRWRNVGPRRSGLDRAQSHDRTHDAVGACFVNDHALLHGLLWPSRSHGSYINATMQATSIIVYYQDRQSTPHRKSSDSQRESTALRLKKTKQTKQKRLARRLLS